MFYLSLVETEAEKSKFTRLYEQYRYLMYQVAYGILQDERIAEDAVHNAFVKLIPHLEKIIDPTCHKTKNFIVIIVRNAALDLYRQRKRQQATSLSEVEFVLQAPDESTSDLREAIAALPETLRDVIELKYLYQHSNHSIAQLLGITEGAVRKRLERAREALRIAWKEGQ